MAECIDTSHECKCPSSAYELTGEIWVSKIGEGYNQSVHNQATQALGCYNWIYSPNMKEEEIFRVQAMEKTYWGTVQGSVPHESICIEIHKVGKGIAAGIPTGIPEGRRGLDGPEVGFRFILLLLSRQIRQIHLQNGAMRVTIAILLFTPLEGLKKNLWQHEVGFYLFHVLHFGLPRSWRWE